MRHLAKLGKLYFVFFGWAWYTLIEQDYGIRRIARRKKTWDTSAHNRKAVMGACKFRITIQVMS